MFCSKFLVFIDNQLRKYCKRVKFSQSSRDHSEGDTCCSGSRTERKKVSGGAFAALSYVMFHTVSLSTWPQLTHTHTYTEQVF